MELNDAELNIINNLKKKKAIPQQDFTAPEELVHQAAIEADKRDLSTPFYVEPSRPEAQKKDYHCVGCGKSFKVFSSQLKRINDTWGYICNKCIANGRGIR